MAKEYGHRPVGIPAPGPSIPALLDTVIAMKQTLEQLVGALGDRQERVVTFRDLVNMGVILEDQIPDIRQQEHGN